MTFEIKSQQDNNLKFIKIMATTVHSTGATAVKLSKPTHIIVRPYTAAGAPGDDYYDLDDVVRDTTKISQDDNSTTDIERETSDTPIMSIVTTGSYQFEAEVADTQADVLVALCGFVKGTSDNKVYAPSGYKNMYAEVAVVFQDGTANKALIVPKLQLNSKTTIESLNTNLAKVTLAGTAQLADMTVNEAPAKVPFYIDTNYTLPVTQAASSGAGK